MDKTYITTVTSRPALPRSRYRTSVSYSGGSSATQAGTSGTDGKDGVGIASIETEGASVSGGVNVVTIKLTDGSESSFNVRNGYDGAAAGFGTPTASATSVPSGTAPTVDVTVSGPDTAKVFAFAFKIPKGRDGSGAAKVVELPDYLDMPSKDEEILYAVVYKGKCDLYLGDIRITNNITAILPSSVLLSGSDSVTGGKNATALYTASLLPDNVTETGLKWICASADGAASIDQNGLLTALGRGTVTIVAASVARPSVKVAKSVSVNLTMRLIMTGQGFGTSRSSTYKYLLVSDGVQSLGLSLVSSDFDGATPANGCGVDTNGVKALRDVISSSPDETMSFFLSQTADGVQTVKVATIDAVGLGQTIVDAWDAAAASVTINTDGDAVALTGLSISGASTVGDASNKSQFGVVYTPSNTTQRGVSWSIVSGSAYASIDESGLLTVKSGANGGAVTIRATSKDNAAIYAEKTVTVTYVSLTIPVTGVSLNKSTLSLPQGGTETLVATVSPARATDKSVVWSSSAPNVAVVDQSGKVTAKSAGSAVVTVTTNDGGFTASCDLTVAAEEKYLRVTPTTVNLAGKFADGDISAVLAVESNQDWTVTCEASWLDLIKDSETGDDDAFVIGANSDNDTGAERTTSVVFTGADGTVVTVAVTQAASTAGTCLLTVNVSPSDATVYYMVGSGSLTKYTGPVRIETGARVTVTAIKSGYVSRAETVTMDSDKTLDWTLPVAPSWTLTAKTVVYVGDDIPFGITDEENVGWRVTCPSWCSLEDDITEGTGAASLLLIVDANDTGDERSGYVYLYASGSASIIRSCKITQEAS